MTYCEFDGSKRTPIISEPGYTLWRCDFCGQHNEETYEQETP